MSIVRLLSVAIATLLGAISLMGSLAPVTAQVTGQSARNVQVLLNNTTEQKVDVYLANPDGTDPQSLTVLEPFGTKPFSVPSGKMIIFGMNRKPFQRYIATGAAFQDVQIVLDTGTAAQDLDTQAQKAVPVGKSPTNDNHNCAQAVTTLAMNQCAQAELARADQALNAAYKAALAFIAESQGEPPFDAKQFEAALRASQRAWIAWRDAECEALIPMFWTGGTATTAAVLGCLSDKTKARTSELLERFEPA